MKEVGCGCHILLGGGTHDISNTVVLHSLGTFLDFQCRLSKIKRLSCEALSLYPLIGDFFDSCEVDF